MDDHNPYNVEDHAATAELYDLIVENMTAGDIKGLAFEIGVSPEDLDGALADELARSLIHTMAQRSELQLLALAMRDLFPADYSAAAREE